MAQQPINKGNPAAPGSVQVVDLPANQAAGADNLSGSIDPSLLQEVIQKYAQQTGQPDAAAHPATGENLSVTAAGFNGQTGAAQYVVSTDVSAGNNQNLGLADEPAGGDEVPPDLRPISRTPEFRRAVQAVSTDPFGAGNDIVNLGISKLFRKGNINPQALVQIVLRQAYQGNAKDLIMYAKQVGFYNNVKDQLRSNMEAANNYLADNMNPDGSLGGNGFQIPKDPSGVFTGDDQPVMVDHKEEKSEADAAKKAETPEGGGPAPTPEGGDPANPPADGGAGQPKILTEANAVQAYVQSMDNQLQSVGGDQQMAQLRLQTLSQNQSTLAQDMSNLSKTYHDTLMAMVRNLNG